MNNLAKYYKESKFNNIIIDYNGLFIPFNPSWKNISIALSGGADSTMLTYILCDLIIKNKSNCNVHIVYNIRCWKTRPWQEHIALNVYEYFVKKFSNIKFYRHINFVPPEFEQGSKEPDMIDEYGKLQSGDAIELRAFAEYILHKFKIDSFFTAVTKNPNIEIQDKLKKRDIEISDENFYLTIREFNDSLVCHPFRFVSKDWIIKQYINNNLQELLNITRSCEGEFNGLNYKTYTPGQYVPICNNCFWCKEKEWALNENHSK